MSDTVVPLKQSYSRHVALEGGVNVRDLGGYRSQDGRTVKWRRIIRSGHLSHLTDSDREQLKEIDLRNVHDFRRSSEIKKFPSTVGDITIISGYEMGVGSMGMFMQAFEREKFTPSQAHAFVVDAYRECVESVTGPYRAFFQHVLAQKEGALLFHCMAGKDRTGLAAALLLYVLGVPRQTIVEDYLLTSQYLPMEVMIDNLLKSRSGLAGLIRENQRSLAPYCGVHGDNIVAFLDEIDAIFGSLDAYLSDGLALTKTDIDDLRERYLG